MTSHDGLETTFGFNLINSIGFQEPYVFSPISLLFALALLGKDEFNSTVSDKYSEFGMKDPEIYNYLKYNLGDVVVKGDSGVNDPRRNIHNQTRIFFNGAWESVLQQKRVGIFYPTERTLRAITYMKNEKHVMLSVDDVFQKLTKTRFEKLLQEATLELVHIMIPKLDILQLLINSKTLGLQPPIKTSLKYKHSPRVAGMLYRPVNREPYFFKADSPFVFGVLRNERPVFLGVYS